MKKFFVILAICCFIFVFGCSNSTSKSIDKINSTIEQIRIISNNIDNSLNSELTNTLLGIEKGTTSNREIVEYVPTNSDTSEDDEGTGYNGSTFTSGENINESDIKMYSNNQNVFVQNETTKHLITCLDSKVNSLQSYCSILNNKKFSLSNSQNNTITDICNNLNNTTKKILTNKNDIDKEFSLLSNASNGDSTYSIDNSYNSLKNYINLRNSYIITICYGIDNLYQLLYSCNTSTNENNGNEETNNSLYNIDSYKNSVKNNQTNNTKSTNNIINENYNYNQNYGYGRTNPYYSYGYAGRFGGMFGNYPYSPYTNYNPYMPNIDTYGSFKNIDTYKSVDDLNNLNQNEDRENQNNNNKEENENLDDNTQKNFSYPNNMQIKLIDTNLSLHILKDNKPPKIEKLEKN